MCMYCKCKTLILYNDVRNYVSSYALNLCLQPTIKWFPLLPYINATASPHFKHGHSQLSQPSGLSLDSFVMMVTVIEPLFHEYWFVATILLVPETSLKVIFFKLVGPI